jgi:hypothetical protein
VFEGCMYSRDNDMLRLHDMIHKLAKNDRPNNVNDSHAHFYS